MIFIWARKKGGGDTALFFHAIGNFISEICENSVFLGKRLYKAGHSLIQYFSDCVASMAVFFIAYKLFFYKGSV